MIYSILLTIPVALWLLYKFPFWEAARDYAAIEANGSADTLKEAFHFWRGVRRGLLQGGIAWAGAAPLLAVDFTASCLLAAALAVGGLAWFFITFNLKLSLLRGLDPYYLSADPHAAHFPDRLLTNRGWNLKTVLQWVLWLGFANAALLAVAAVWVAVKS